MSVGWRGEVMINGGLSICIFPLDLIQSNMDMRPAEGHPWLQPGQQRLRWSFMLWRAGARAAGFVRCW